VKANKLRARLYRCKLKLEREGRGPCKCYGDQLGTECLHFEPSNKSDRTR